MGGERRGLRDMINRDEWEDWSRDGEKGMLNDREKKGKRKRREGKEREREREREREGHNRYSSGHDGDRKAHPLVSSRGSPGNYTPKVLFTKGRVYPDGDLQPSSSPSSSPLPSPRTVCYFPLKSV